VSSFEVEKRKELRGFIRELETQRRAEQRAHRNYLRDLEARKASAKDAIAALTAQRQSSRNGDSEGGPKPPRRPGRRKKAASRAKARA
jgi:hypothetical protein